MGEHPPEWLADSARFFRQHIEAEGEELNSASVAPDGGENTRPQPEEEASVQEAEPTYRKDSTKKPIHVQGDDQAFQTAILFDVEPTIQEWPLPWEGRPPRQDVDPVGIPDSMTCTVP